MSVDNPTLNNFEKSCIDILAKNESIICMSKSYKEREVVADYLLYKSLTDNKRVAYILPTSLLASQKLYTFKKKFGASNVGYQNKPIIISTEIPESTDVVIIDNLSHLQYKLPTGIKANLYLSSPFVCSYERHIISERFNTSFIHTPYEGRMALLDDSGKYQENEYGKYMKAVNKHPVIFEGDKILTSFTRELKSNAIFLVFSNKECERYAKLISLQIKEIKSNEILHKYKSKLSIQEFEMLSKGVAYYHRDMSNILKDTVGVLYNEGLINILFTPESAWPTRMLVFLDLKKYDSIKKEYTVMTRREYLYLSSVAEEIVYLPVGEILNSRQFKKISG
jgi:superfamily II RNA helicase